MASFYCEAATGGPRRRVALPNVDKSREGWYLALFSVQCLVCLALLGWYEVADNTADSALATVVAVGKGMGQLVIVVAAWTVILLEGYSMLAERYLRRRYQEGRVEGRSEGRIEGRVEGRSERDAEWAAWLVRRQEAEAQGEPFDEPSPAEKEALDHPRNHS